MVATRKKLETFDYEALASQTSPAFVKKIKLECDSEDNGFVSSIERFDSEYPTTDSEYLTYSVTIVARQKLIGGRSRGMLYCHYFQHDSSDPDKPIHRKIPYFVFEEFKKLCVGLKDD